MKTTVFSRFKSRELVELALCRDQEKQTELDVELAQRFDVALDLLDELKKHDARRKSQERR